MLHRRISFHDLQALDARHAPSHAPSHGHHTASDPYPHTYPLEAWMPRTCTRYNAAHTHMMQQANKCRRCHQRTSMQLRGTHMPIPHAYTSKPLTHPELRIPHAYTSKPHAYTHTPSVDFAPELIKANHRTPTLHTPTLHTPGLTRAQMRRFLQTCRFKRAHHKTCFHPHNMCKRVCSKEINKRT